jgi:two-component system chemotaxis response regulator CheB
MASDIFKPLRVLIADDSNVARALLRSVLEEAGGIQVAGEAENGRQAVEMAASLKPDLIVMDLQMPVMDGMSAISEIMARRATPILVASDAADARRAYEAVRRGALEVVAKPDFSPVSGRAFAAKVRLLAGVPVIAHIRPKGTAASPSNIPSPSLDAVQPCSDNCGRVFAVAASTGGPQALCRIFSLLPADFPAPLLVAQHISDGFAGGMASWLDGFCRLTVRLAIHGEPVRPGTAYIVPSEAHGSVGPGLRIVLTAPDNRDLYRPSCNRLLESVANTCGPCAVGVILTGMGEDGVEGMTRIHRQGGTTWVRTGRPPSFSG